MGSILFETDICAAELNFNLKPSSRCPRISQECKDLVRSCLRIRPQDRVNINNLLSHAWLSETQESQESPMIDNYHSLDTKMKSINISNDCVETYKSFINSFSENSYINDFIVNHFI